MASTFDFVTEHVHTRRTPAHPAGGFIVNTGHRTTRITFIVALVCASLSGACQDTVSALSAAVSPPPAAPIVAGQIGGRWGTHWGNEVCNLELTQRGQSVTGRYTSTGAAPGTVTGTFTSNVLTGTWTDQSGGHGGIALAFTPDSRTFTGTWGNGESTSNGGSWTGRR